MHRLPLRELPCISRAAAVAWVGAALLALGGCATLDPDTRLVAQSSTELKEDASGAQPDPGSPGWWAVLNDPLLVGLVERSQRDKLDLREAVSRVREARARRASVAADRFPTISTRGAATSRTHAGDEASPDAANELYSAGFDASWELYVFGGPRSVTGLAPAELEAGVEDVRDALITLFAEIALNYVEARSFQTRLALADEHLRAQSEIYVITRWRRQAGLTTRRDFERARRSLEQTREQIPLLEAGLAQARHRLAILLGQPPDELVPELTAAKAIPSARVGLAVGVPANALRRRPDVRRAERELAEQLDPAATGRYPGFPLLGSIGLEAMAPGRQSSSVAIASAIDGNHNWTLFDADSIRQNIEVRTPPQEEALIGYEAAVITALKEVDNMLVAYTQWEARRESLERATRSAKSAAELANKKYISGSTSFEAALDAQRSLLSLQNQLVASEGEAASLLIQLYKALAGGWTSLGPAAAQRVAQEPSMARQ